MLLTRNQFLVILTVLIVSCGAWGIILKMFIDSSLELKWSMFVWFFGACFVSAAVIGAAQYFQALRMMEEIDRHEKDRIEFSQTIKALNDAANELGKSFAGFGRRVTDVQIDGEINPELSTKGDGNEK